MTLQPFLRTTKISNPEFATLFMHGNKPYGEFKALVRFATPEMKPDYIKIMEMHSPGFFKVSIPCGKMEQLEKDDNILSIDLREHSI